MKTMHLISALALLSAAAIVACSGNDSSNHTPTASTTPSTSPTASPSATPSIDDEVGAAYLEYWDAYSAALLELDASLAQTVASGEELNRIADEVEGLRVQGLAMRVRVEHNFAVVEASENVATIVDDLINNSFLVDAQTKEPPEAAGSGERLQDTFDLERVNGRWVVLKTTRLKAGG